MRQVNKQKTSGNPHRPVTVRWRCFSWNDSFGLFFFFLFSFVVQSITSWDIWKDSGNKKLTHFTHAHFLNMNISRSSPWYYIVFSGTNREDTSFCLFPYPGKLGQQDKPIQSCIFQRDLYLGRSTVGIKVGAGFVEVKWLLSALGSLRN